MKIDKSFHSEKDSNKTYQLASGYISQTAILFEKENIVAVIQASGNVSFYDRNDVLIAAGNAPSVDDGRGVYEEINCQVENNLLKLQFPIYEWIDNYPNCDGEYDRWDSRKVGAHTLTLGLLTYSIL